MIQISKSATVSPLADIEDSIRGSKIIVGDHTVIDSFVKIKPAGGKGDVVIGSYCVVNSGCVLYSGNGIKIGNHVAIASNCTLAPTNHAYETKERLIREQGFKKSKGGIVIEDDVWIGANCVLLDGALLRKGCVIGAGSIVRGEIPEYSVAVGQPAQVTGKRK